MSSRGRERREERGKKERVLSKKITDLITLILIRNARHSTQLGYRYERKRREEKEKRSRINKKLKKILLRRNWDEEERVLHHNPPLLVLSSPLLLRILCIFYSTSPNMSPLTSPPILESRFTEKFSKKVNLHLCISLQLYFLLIIFDSSLFSLSNSLIHSISC